MPSPSHSRKLPAASRSHGQVGTTAYMSPERLKGDEYSYASDRATAPHRTRDRSLRSPPLALLAFLCVLFTSSDPMKIVFEYLEKTPARTNLILLAHRINNKWELTRKANLFPTLLSE